MARRKKAKIAAKLKPTKQLPANFISIFKKKALVKVNKLSTKFAKEIAQEAKSIIRNQTYDWAPLKKGYAEAKKRKGLDPRILIATKAYVNFGIGVYEKDGKIFVGPKPGIHKPSGITYQQLAKWLEYGTWKMPARPLWRPLLSVAIRRKKQLAKLYKKAIAEELKKEMRK